MKGGLGHYICDHLRPKHTHKDLLSKMKGFLSILFLSNLGLGLRIFILTKAKISYLHENIKINNKFLIRYVRR